jgi:hypothetical protein
MKDGGEITSVAKLVELSLRNPPTVHPHISQFWRGQKNFAWELTPVVYRPYFPAQKLCTRALPVARSGDRGFPLHECGACTLGRMPRRGREAGDVALHPRERPRSPDRRSTRRSD